MNKTYNCIAKTFYGLEEFLADELAGLQAKSIKVLNRAVAFTCDKATLYRVNLSSRLAISILVEVDKFWARNEENFYQQIKKIEWDQVLSSSKTFMIQTTVRKSKTFKHSQYVGLKAKDAIADYFVEKANKRPNVDTVDPDVKIHIHIQENKVNVSLNSSGEPLFKRGYRVEQASAPINEVLAAGILAHCGWRGNQPLLDPMCGSGTFLIEAAMIAHHIPPGMRRRFGFQNWLNYTPELWERVYKEEVNKITDIQVDIRGADLHNRALAATRENISQAFLEDSIIVGKQDFFTSEWTKEEKPLLIINPPYDKRLRVEDVRAFYKKIGDQLKFNYSGADVWIITSQLEAMKFIGLRPNKKIKLFNGPLECRLLHFEMYKGKKGS